MRVKRTPEGEWVWTNPEVEHARLAWRAESGRAALVSWLGLALLGLGWAAVFLLGMPSWPVAGLAGVVLGASGAAWLRMHRAWTLYQALTRLELQSLDSKSPE